MAYLKPHAHQGHEKKSVHQFVVGGEKGLQDK